MSPAAAMADWLVAGEAPAHFSIDRDCELKAADGEKPVVRYARHALDIDEVRQHIQAGKQPTRLALTWRDRVSFTLTEGLQLKKISFLDGVFEGQAKASADESFDADAAIATGELAPMIDDLIDALGGEQVIGGAAPAPAISTPLGPASTAAGTPSTPIRTTSQSSDLPPWEAAEA
jgi:recombination associated protein RdgC